MGKKKINLEKERWRDLALKYTKQQKMEILYYYWTSYYFPNPWIFLIFWWESRVLFFIFFQTMSMCFSDSIKICLMQIVPGADVPAKLGRENVQWGHKEDGSSLCSAKILADHHWACPDVKFQSVSIIFLLLYFSFPAFPSLLMGEISSSPVSQAKDQVAVSCWFW